jgi:ribose transport system substrate-binding protein
MMSLNAPIWVELMKYGDECAKQYNSKVIWKSAEGSLDNQISLVEGFIEQKVDCIMIDPFDAVSVIPVIKESLNAGIPFITMGNLVEGKVSDDLYNTCTTYPDVRDTSALTDLLIAAGGKDKTYIGVSGLTGNFVSDTREKAFIDTCKAAGVKYIATPGKWDPANNLKVTQDMVAEAGDNLGGMYNLDDSMCIISMQATPKGLPVCGHNGEAAAYDKIDSGEMMATILIGGAHIGFWNVLTAVKLAQGEKLAHQVYLKTYIVMQQANIDKYWTGKLDAKYPNLKAVTPADARKISFEPAEMLDSLN